MFYQPDLSVVCLLIPVSIKSGHEIICNKLFRFECIYLEYPFRNAHNSSTKRRNTFKIKVLESNRRDLSIDTLKSQFGSEVAEIPKNGLHVYGLYGKGRIYTYTLYIYGVYCCSGRIPHSLIYMHYVCSICVAALYELSTELSGSYDSTH